MSHCENQLPLCPDNPVLNQQSHNHLEQSSNHSNDANKGHDDLIRTWNKAMKSAWKAQKLLQDIMDRLDNEICNFHRKGERHKKNARYDHQCSANNLNSNSSSSSSTTSSSSISSDSELDNHNSRGRSCHVRCDWKNHSNRRCCSHSHRDRHHSSCRRSHSYGGRSKCSSRCPSRCHSTNRKGNKQQHQSNNNSQESHLNCDCSLNRLADASNSQCTIEDVHSL